MDFEKESGYTVDYREDIEDNVSFNGKVAPQLRNGQSIGYDLVTLTWQSGFARLVWRKDKVPHGLRSVSELWDPALHGRVVVPSEMRDTIGLSMIQPGGEDRPAVHRRPVHGWAGGAGSAGRFGIGAEALMDYYDRPLTATERVQFSTAFGQVVQG